MVLFLKIVVIVCLLMSTVLFVGRVYMGIVTLSVKLLRQKPEKWYKWEPIKDDLEEGNLAYPMVLVQIPMCNEKEVMHFHSKHSAALTLDNRNEHDI